MLALFVVETNRNNNSDWLYINRFVKHYYEIGSNALKPVYLNGKGNYKKQSVQTEIGRMKKKFLCQNPDDDRVAVFYCIDIDDTCKGPNAHENSDKAKEIEDYCKQKNYEFIWFYEVIEHVFIGKRVDKSEKRETAKRFALMSSFSIDYDEISCLNHSKCRIGTSNINHILQEYFTKKTG